MSDSKSESNYSQLPQFANKQSDSDSSGVTPDIREFVVVLVDLVETCMSELDASQILGLYQLLEIHLSHDTFHAMRSADKEKYELHIGMVKYILSTLLFIKVKTFVESDFLDRRTIDWAKMNDDSSTTEAIARLPLANKDKKEAGFQGFIIVKLLELVHLFLDHDQGPEILTFYWEVIQRKYEQKPTDRKIEAAMKMVFFLIRDRGLIARQEHNSDSSVFKQEPHKDDNINQ